MKQQGYYSYLGEMYGLHVVSSKTLEDLETSWSTGADKQDDPDNTIAPPSDQSLIMKKERPPLLLEPMFVILGGAAAAVVQ